MVEFDLQNWVWVLLPVLALSTCKIFAGFSVCGVWWDRDEVDVRELCVLHT